MLYTLCLQGELDHDSGVSAVSLHEEQMLASGTHDGTVTIWHISTQSPLLCLQSKSIVSLLGSYSSQ